MALITTVSSKGQITIPASLRKKHNYKKYLIRPDGVNLIFQPVELKVITNENKTVKKDDFDQNFHLSAESSFAFWDNEKDDKLSDFYDNLPDIS